MKILGVDIGSFSIKVAELDVTSKGHVINQFMEFPLSPDPQVDKLIETLEVLRGLSAQYDPNKTKWVFGLRQQQVSVHRKTFPFRERSKILKSLPFELEDDIPLDIDDSIFDAKFVEFVGPLTEVLTVASPKEAVQELLALVKDGGIDPDIVSVEGLALSSVFEEWHTPPPEIPPSLRDPEQAAAMAATLAPQVKLVLHMGHQRTNLLVYRDGGLFAVRSLTWGGNDLIQALMRTMNVPVFEAVKVLHTKSFILMNSAGASKEQLALSKAISSTLDFLMHDLRLTLLEVRAGLPGAQFIGIELMGGVSQIQNIGAYITQALELPANTSRYMEGRPARGFADAHTEAVCGVALGLAIEGLRKPRNPAVNLRRGEFARENVTFKRFWEKWKIPVQIAAAAFSIFLIYSMARESIATGLVEAVDERMVEVAQKNAGMKIVAGSDSKVRSYIETQKRKIKNHQALSQIAGYNSAMDIVAKLSEKLPVLTPARAGQGIDVTRLTIENEDLTIEGRVLGSTAVAQIERALNEIAKPKTVAKAPPSGVPQGEGTPFAYKLKVNRKP